MSIKTLVLYIIFLYNYMDNKLFYGVITMTARTKSNLLLVLALVLAIVLICTPFFLDAVNRNKTSAPDLVQGQVDYSTAKLSKNDSLYLKGEWYCYEGHIISDAVDSDGTLVKIPASLSSLSHNSDNSGCRRSYKTTIKNLDFKNAMILIPNFAGTYNIFVNGELVSQSGSINEKGSSATMELSAVPFDFQKGKSYEIVIEVLCDIMPAMYMTPVISEFEHRQASIELTTFFRCMMFGIILFSGLFILIYSIKNINIFSSKWLPVLSIVVAFRMMISTEGYTAFRFFFPSIDYENMTMLICMSTFIIKLVALLFYSETLDVKIGKRTFITVSSVSIICAGITILFPFVFFNPYYYIIIQVAALPLDIILLSRLTDSVVRKAPYAKLYTVGYIVLISGIMTDSFYTNGLIPTVSSNYLPVACLFFIIVFLSVFFDKITAIYRASLKAAELDKELTAANTAVMISQIQPHFLYNALNTIKYLIKRDPKAAEKAVISFSKYLRGNMDSIAEKKPIPFIQELEHIKNYCDIELLRFGDKVNIVYDTEFTNFSVPSLTIQPLVENAIKHGVTKKAEGGTVTITTKEIEEYIYIYISDDGVGFDPLSNDYTPDDNRSHVGLQNVTNRLKIMMNAEVEIESQIDRGTTITIKIPKEEAK